MKVLKRLVSAVICGMLICNTFVYTGYGEQSLRVGLERFYMDVPNITAGNDSLTIAYSGGSVKLESDSGFKFEPVSGSYRARIQCGTLETALEGGLAVYDSEGWGSYTGSAKAEEETQTTTVIITEPEIDAEEETVTELTTEQPPAQKSGMAYELGRSAIKVTYDGGSFVINSGGVTVSSSAGYVDLGEMAYRGKIEITNDGGSLDAVNIITMDEYLYGVIPAEVYDFWPDDALKAQTVAARTFATYHVGRHSGSGYDLCDNTHCQQYSGYYKETSNTTRAVDETSGELAYYNGKPINAEYFDCDGGYTLGCDEVWGGDPLPYLQSTPDPYELGAREWERSFTLEEIGAMAKAAGHDVGSVTNVAITKQRGGILAEEVTIAGTEDTYRLTGQEIKRFFKKDGENLLSRCFTISGSSACSNNVYVTGAAGTAGEIGVNVISTVDSGGVVTVLQDINLVMRGKDGDVVISANGGKITEAADSIVISGAGWGHGVGLSQCGAYGMATKGYDYKEILKYYYKGIEVR